MKYCSDCKDTKKDNNLCDEHYDILEEVRDILDVTGAE